MRTAIRYQRDNSELDRAINRLNMLRHYLSPRNTYRPRIRIVSDQFNNLNRRCNISGDTNGDRLWKIIATLKDQEYHRYYLVTNLMTNEKRMVSETIISNLY